VGRSRRATRQLEAEGAGHRRTLAERLKSTVELKPQQMIRRNRTRMDFLARFQLLIDAYNAGSLTVEAYFGQLVELARSLEEEDRRAVGEQLSEEELVVFDLLTKPEMTLSTSERAAVKATARQLLETLKRETLVLDWRKRQQARAQVRVTIADTLNAGLPDTYTPALFEAKTAAVFQHVYESYYGDGRSVYAAAA
jgi:type I restriction enzyme, R subunit